MNTARSITAIARELRILQSPWLWPEYPWLAVKRQLVPEGSVEQGTLYDAAGVSGIFGYRCTVFIADLNALPQTEAAFFQVPRHVYDNFEELLHAGWRLV